MAAAFLEVFHARLEHPGQWKVSLPVGVGLDGILVPSQPNRAVLWASRAARSRPFSLPPALLQQHPHPGQNPGQKIGLGTQISSVQNVLQHPECPKVFEKSLKLE